MKYTIGAIGKIKKSFFREGCDLYKEHLQKIANIEEIEKKSSSKSTRLDRQVEESQALWRLKEATKADWVIALDETGKEWTSKKWADKIDTLESTGRGKALFLIGGADGHSDELKGQVDELWSLGKLTLPHELARLILFEQLYRAETIRSGHPYHRE